jgi:hypothetical protein
MISAIRIRSWQDIPLGAATKKSSCASARFAPLITGF